MEEEYDRGEKKHTEEEEVEVEINKQRNAKN
jgi:hypothetical protein